MKRPHVLVQVAAIASSLLLAGGLISYRAGAFNRFIAPSPVPADPADTPSGEEQTSDGATQPDLAIMSSSKSATISFTGKVSRPPSQKTEAPQQPAPDPEPAKPPTIMYGTKAPATPVDLGLPGLGNPPGGTPSQPPAPPPSPKPAP